MFRDDVYPEGQTWSWWTSRSWWHFLCAYPGVKTSRRPPRIKCANWLTGQWVQVKLIQMDLLHSYSLTARRWDISRLQWPCLLTQDWQCFVDTLRFYFSKKFRTDVSKPPTSCHQLVFLRLWGKDECFALWWRAAVVQAGPRIDLSRCSSCRRWAWPRVGAGKCKQWVRSLDTNALMMLQLSHTHHSFAEHLTLLWCIFNTSALTHLTSTLLLPLHCCFSTFCFVACRVFR